MTLPAVGIMNHTANTPVRASALLALLLSAPAAGVEARPLPALTPATGTAAQDDQMVWRAEFEKAMAVGAHSEMERLVKGNTHAAVEWIIDTAQGIATKPNEALETRMEALRKAWKGGIGTKFADNMYEYFSLLEPALKGERLKLMGRYDKALARYNGNLVTKDQPTFGVLYVELEGLAGAFAEVGDHYHAGQSWLLVYNCIEERNRGEQADLYKACRALKNVVAERKLIDLQDQSYLGAATTYNYLKAQGYDAEAGAEGGGGESGPAGPPKSGPSKEGAAVVVTLGFEMILDYDAYERPSYYADELHNLWTRISLQKKGSQTTFSSLGELSPKLQRTGSAEVLIDADGDGQGEVKLPLRGNVDPIEFEIGGGAEKRRWGCLTKIGTSSDMYQNIQVSMSPNDDQMQIYLAPAASMAGEVGGIALRIIDENMDGVYGGEPKLWAHDGLTKDMLHPEFDSILIGDEKRARPWSEYQKIGEQWYRLEIVNGGTSLKAFPAELETGTLKLAYKGEKPTWLVVRGKGKLENCYFDLMQKGLELPAGAYELFCGDVRKGKKQQTVKALILPGKQMESWRVNAGEATTAKLGAPFGFAFDFEESEDSVVVKGESIAVTGAGGERYERLWNCVVRPEASYRPKGKGKGSKPEDMHVAMSQDEINELGWKVAWFPYDLTLEKKGKSEESEVQLIEKKNKLFGKIESDWKE
jgi:hypothetical protein